MARKTDKIGDADEKQSPGNPTQKSARSGGSKGNRTKTRNPNSGGLRNSSTVDTSSDGRSDDGIAANDISTKTWSNMFGDACSNELIKISESRGFIQPEFLDAQLDLKLVIDIDSLSLQAICFGTSFARNGMEGYRLTGRRDLQSQVQVFAEAWIYSLLQAYHGAVYGYTSPINLNGSLFIGHGWLFDLIKNGRPAQYSMDGPTIYRNLHVSTETHSQNIESLSNAFMVCRVALENISADGQIVVPFYENILARIRNGLSNLEGDSKLQILEGVDSSKFPELSHYTTSPLGSSFRSSTERTRLFVSNDSSSTLMQDSVILNKGLFITYESYRDTYTEANAFPPTFVTAYDIPDLDPFIHREVELLSGMKCVPVRRLSDYETRELPRTPEDPNYRINSGDFGNRPWFRRPGNEDNSTS